MAKDKWLTDFSIEELKAKILHAPFKPFEIDGIPVFMNREKALLPGEIFKQHPTFPVEASNLGRIKRNGEILLQQPDWTKLDAYGYLWVNVPNIDDWERYVYRLVAKTWCDRPDPNLYTTVHHISNNGMDNRVENLMWVTCEQHREIHAFGSWYCGTRKENNTCDKDCKFYN
jgi:hypothetical protein